MSHTLSLKLLAARAFAHVFANGDLSEDELVKMNDFPAEINALYTDILESKSFLLEVRCEDTTTHFWVGYYTTAQDILEKFHLRGHRIMRVFLSHPFSILKGPVSTLGFPIGSTIKLSINKCVLCGMALYIQGRKCHVCRE